MFDLTFGVFYKTSSSQAIPKDPQFQALTAMEDILASILLNLAILEDSLGVDMSFARSACVFAGFM